MNNPFEGAPRPDRPAGTQGLQLEEPLIFERGGLQACGVSLPEPGVPEVDPANEIPARLLRAAPDAEEGLPAVSEPEVVRHFTRLSQWNYGIDSGLFPLGSCTMKYNPRVNEAAVSLPGHANTHPYLEDDEVQGPLKLLHQLEQALCAICGFDAATLQPAAGAQGELTGVLMLHAYHKSRGDDARRVILVPDSAHGTNPASSVIAGFDVVEVKAGPKGYVEAAAVKALLGDHVAGIMLTNPNTLGIFEQEIGEIAALVHEAGGLVYCDGANLNALMGHARPGDMDVDVMHVNLHKTFSTPHGGGGPGAGPVLVKALLEPFLPLPRIEKTDDGRLRRNFERPQSIGAMKAFWGNYGVLLRAYCYIRELGAEGLKASTELAVLNARYLRALLSSEEGGRWPLPFEGPTLHEAVFNDAQLEPFGVSTVDVAKRLIDLGFHPPTIYFPLVVHGAIMVEPTESESKAGLEAFVAAMRQIREEAEQAPERLHAAPIYTIRQRLDETQAARRPLLRWTPSLNESLAAAAAESKARSKAKA